MNGKPQATPIHDRVRARQRNRVLRRWVIALAIIDVLALSYGWTVLF